MGHLHLLLDQMGLDKMGLDEMGINPVYSPPLFASKNGQVLMTTGSLSSQETQVTKTRNSTTNPAVTCVMSVRAYAKSSSLTAGTVSLP